MLRKLVLREGHLLVPWVSTELSRRFDYECCEDLETFKSHRGLALTINRHVKTSYWRHEKDDRDQAVDARNFVLGWDNREKKQRLSDEIRRLAAAEEKCEKTVVTLESRLASLRNRQSAIDDAKLVKSFSDIDYRSHDDEVAALEKERRAIESKSNAIKLLKARLDDAHAEEERLRDRRDQAVASESDCAKRIADGEKRLGNAASHVKAQKASGEYDVHATWFPAINELLAQLPLKCDELASRKDEFRASHEGVVRRLRSAIEPVRTRLTDAMVKYLRHCPEDAGDLHPSADYLDDFLALRQRIIEDDLPRHERRFKDRLNQKVIEEIGLFRNALEQERRVIQEKIETLNLSLKQLPYRDGAPIQLEPRPVRDSEIVDFQAKLRECIEGSFDDSSEANEERFRRIHSLIERLKDETNRRWRDKVTDVRRWFDFRAIVVDLATGKTMSIYEDSSGQSGGEKAKLAFTILVAAIAYQYDLDPDRPTSDRFHFVVVDEMFSKVDDQYAEYALELFKRFGLQLLIVAPLDAKARITQPYVGSYLQVVKQANRSTVYEMTAREFERSMLGHQEFSIATEFSDA